MSQLKEQGHGEQAAKDIAVFSLSRSGSILVDPITGAITATPQGVERGNMTAEDRAIDRASSISGRDSSSYTYDAETNRATLI